MGCYVEDVIKIVKAEVGYLEKANDPLAFLKIRTNTANWKKANDPLAFYQCQKCLDVFLGDII